MITFLLLVLSAGHFTQPVAVDVIEFNHAGPRDAGINQVIFRRWQRLAIGNNHYVADWRLDTGQFKIDPQGNSWHIRFKDDGIERHVVTNILRETWTYYDPEMAERNILLQDDRTSYFPDVEVIEQ